MDDWVDFSAVSPAEELTSRFHEILAKWGVNPVNTQHPGLTVPQAVETETIEFDSRIFKFSFYRRQVRAPAPGEPGAECFKQICHVLQVSLTCVVAVLLLGLEWPPGLKHLPAGALDLLDPSIDFLSRAHRIQKMFGVREFVVLTPSHHSTASNGTQCLLLHIWGRKAAGFASITISCAKRLVLPQAWNAGDASPQGGDSRAAAMARTPNTTSFFACESQIMVSCCTYLLQSSILEEAGTVPWTCRMHTNCCQPCVRAIALCLRLWLLEVAKTLCMWANLCNLASLTHSAA
jgi:hypothetical protein